LIDVAASISEGHDVDWGEARRLLADDLDTAVLEELHVLDGIAQIHRHQWGALDIIEPIGHGAFGTVYRAFDRDLQRDVALKLRRPAADGTPFDAERLVREARRLARVKHHHVVAVLSAERKGNEVGIVMEWLKGQTIDRIVQTQGALGAREAAVIGMDICRALAAVHAAGLLHGDVKAHNVMREEGGRIVLMDFGASRDLSHAPAAGTDFAGTPIYMAPEVFAGEPRSTASDVYSLGVLLFYMVSGHYPIDGDTRSAINRQHTSTEARRHLRELRPDLPEAFVQIVQRAIAERPDGRFGSVGALEDALSSFLGPIPAPAPSRRLVTLLLAAATVVLAAIAAVLMWRPAATNESTATAAATTPSVTVDAASLPYDVEAAIYRAVGDSDVRLAANDAVTLGDQLFMKIKTSVPTYVYVVNEDEQGHHYLLFPLSGYSLSNPLPPGGTHSLPGTRGQVEQHWQVTEVGKREHLIIFVSPTRLTSFEQMFAELPRAAAGTPLTSAPIPQNALNMLRGIGGVVSATTSPLNQPLYEQYRTPLPDSVETTSGEWVRQFTVVSAR
jgi:hypothetical protein